MKGPYALPHVDAAPALPGIKVRYYEVTINPSSVTAATGLDQTDISVPGLKLTDMVFVNAAALTAGLGIGNCFVSAVDTLTITWLNVKASGTIDMTSLALRILAFGP